MRSFLFFLVLLPLAAYSQNTVKEPSTEKDFPATVTFKSGADEYSVSVTGLAVRKKFFFKVYGIAHYAQDADKIKRGSAFQELLTDGKAKQITMDFARDVDFKSITDSYNDAFKQNSTADELKTIQPSIDKFLGFFTKELKENEQYVLRWIPGGTIMSIVQGEEKPPITDKTFARILWSIWLGEDSVVDRDDLVNRLSN